MKGRLYYSAYLPYIVFTVTENGEVKAYTRRAHEIDKENRTCKIRFKNQTHTVEWHY